MTTRACLTECVRADNHDGECAPPWTSEDEERLTLVRRRVTTLEQQLGDLHVERQGLERRRRAASELRGR